MSKVQICKIAPDPLRGGEAVAAAEQRPEVADLVDDARVRDAVLVHGGDAHARPVLARDGHVLAVLLPLLGVFGSLGVVAVGVDPHALVAERHKLVGVAHVRQHELAVAVARVGSVEKRASGGLGHRSGHECDTGLRRLGRLGLDVLVPALLAEQLEVRDSAAAGFHGARTRNAPRVYTPSPRAPPYPHAATRPLSIPAIRATKRVVFATGRPFSPFAQNVQIFSTRELKIWTLCANFVIVR